MDITPTLRRVVKLRLRRHARRHEPEGNPGQKHDESDGLEEVRYKSLNHLVGSHHYTVTAASHCSGVFWYHDTMMAGSQDVNLVPLCDGV